MNDLKKLDEKIKILQSKKYAIEAKIEREKEEEQFKGYLYWCREGCGLVKDKNHRCEQWCSVLRIPPNAVEAIQNLFKEKVINLLIETYGVDLIKGFNNIIDCIEDIKNL